MTAFFTKVLEFFNLIWDIIAQLVSSLFTLFGIIKDAITLPTEIIQYGLPTIFVTSLTAVAAIAVAKLMVGR